MPPALSVMVLVMKLKMKQAAAVAAVLTKNGAFKYHAGLDSHLWDKNMEMRPLVSNALQMVAWSYLSYMQQIGFPLTDDCIRDIFVHGSSTNFYYDATSDIDICIVADLGKMRDRFPGVDLYPLTKGALGSWLRNFRIKICGRGIDIEIVEYDAPKYGGDFYKVGPAWSLMRGTWIRCPVHLPRREIRQMRRTARVIFREYRRMYRKIIRNQMGAEFIETFLMRLSVDRRESYAKNFAQPVTAEVMAFRMFRRCGMLRRLRERARLLRSRNFNIE